MLFRSTPAQQEFTIKMSRDGDIVEGMDFVLKSTLPDIIPETEKPDIALGKDESAVITEANSIAPVKAETIPNPEIKITSPVKAASPAKSWPTTVASVKQESSAKSETKATTPVKTEIPPKQQIKAATPVKVIPLAPSTDLLSPRSSPSPTPFRSLDAKVSPEYFSRSRYLSIYPLQKFSGYHPDIS